MTNTDAKEIKHCVDCEHIIESDNGKLYSRCALSPAEDNAEWIVNGGDIPKNYCSIARGVLGSCGREAKLFTPRTTKQMPAIEAESSAA